jgi:hypothetical protein
MSQTAFKISEGLDIKGLVLDNNSGTLTWDGANIATESYVDTAIGNISIPPAYITSVGTAVPYLTVTDGELNFSIDSIQGRGLYNIVDPMAHTSKLAVNTNAIIGYAQGLWVNHDDSDKIYVNANAVATKLVSRGLYQNPSDNRLAVNTNAIIASGLYVNHDNEDRIAANTNAIAYAIAGNGIYPNYSNGTLAVNTNAIIGTGLWVNHDSSDRFNVNTNALIGQYLYVNHDNEDRIYVNANAVASSIAGTGITFDANSGTLTAAPGYISSVSSPLAVDNAGNLTVDFTGYATETYVGNQGYITSSGQYIQSTDSNFTVTSNELTLNSTISVSEIDVAGSGDFTVTGSANIVLNPASGSKAYIGSVSSNNEIVTMGNVPAGYTDTDVDNHLSGGDGITYSSGAISVDYSTGLTINGSGQLAVDTDTIATQTYVGNQGFLTSSTQYIQSVGTNLSVDGSGNLTVDLASYALTTDIPSLSGYATESYVGTAISNIVDGAPDLLNTLNELAAAINDDANYATTLTTALGNKQNTLTAGNGIDIVSDTISLNPDVVINTVSLTDSTSGVSASSDVFGNTTTSTYAMGSDVTVGTLVSTAKATDLFLQILDNSGNSRTSKLTAVFNGGSAPIWTEYGVVDSGTTIAATVSFDSSKHIIVNVTGSGTYAVRGVVTNLN